MIASFRAICSLRAMWASTRCLRLLLAGTAAALLMTAAPAHAERRCTLLVDVVSGETLKREGTLCSERTSPASSFKVALSVIGFDSRILIDAHHPAWPYREEYRAARPAWRQTIDPTLWLRESVVWYSQQLTRALGMDRFRAYVDRFDYGNRDLSGDPGRQNGLTNAWLSSSLAISPVEQAAFLRKLLRDELPASKEAQAVTRATIATYPGPHGWTVHGKTGSGSQARADGTVDDARQFGWFVGWLAAGDRQLIVVRLIKDDAAIEEAGGFRARDGVIADLARLVPQP